MQPTVCPRPARRLALLAAATAATLVASCVLVQMCPAAHAARGRGGALSRSARMLSGMVRHSARRAGHGRSAGVVTIHCCGHRTLAVYYRARPRAGLPWHGTYELTLRRRGRFLESVGVVFFPTGASWSYGGAASSEGPRYEFTISSPRHARGWRLTVSDSYLACPPPAAAAAAQCEGFSDALSLGERQLGRRHLRALLRQALKVVHKARRRVPISSADVTAASDAVRSASAA
ncbi:MAG TPA: hypothetical protein VLZ06_01875 [Solirubrobacteraceae bacterium]|nr:hypothetical protein [Solirubrobacteraceae bacterium]